MRRFAAAAVLALAALPFLASPASAHTTLKSADPASGAQVAPPAQITLTYADPVMVPQVVLTDASGGRHESGPARAVDNKVTQQVNGTLPNGVYNVGWRVVATDGHPVTGSFKFTVKGSSAASAPSSAPAAAPSTAAASDEGSSGSSGWLWVGLVALVVVVAGGGVAWALRSRQS
ncbi:MULTISPECIES: copper resistance CopC family protein [Actinomadura]|uniref:Copper resistance protein CopC n=1 Tax=Actinomadura yumaensis TaxID=111807 RepID=A0ABW2D1G1_9ACTN|nr:copper resistance protein CopC [Actinomadura sp. J1-007]MWK35495.1 copper resistance protein CopC [Actinomadura sp. J1-007]